MAIKEYYNIGEFSDLFGINTQTLYYYDHIGLLKPRFRDPDNGRRQYYFDQVFKLASIRFMRKLDYSIDQIQEYSEITDYRESLEKLRMHSVKMQEQWKKLLLIDKIIQRKIYFIEHHMQDLDVDSITIQDFPNRRYFSLGSEAGVYVRDSFYYYPTIVHYRDKVKFFGAYLEEGFDEIETLHHADDPEEIKNIPSGKYVCAYHTGPYHTIEDTVDRIKNHYPDFKLSNDWFTINIIDQFVDNDPNNYITGVQIQIL